MIQAQSRLKPLADSLAKEMMNTLSDAARQAPGDDAAAALARGKIFQLASYFDEAITSYKSAMALEHDQHEAQARLAYVQSRAHRYESALATAMDLAQANPGFELKEMTSDQVTTAMTLLGDMLVRNKRVKDASEAYKVAAERYKNDAFAAGRLAQSYLVLGENQPAIDQIPNLTANPRFQALEKILILGMENEALLPKLNTDHMQKFVEVSAHGRPMVVDGQSCVAALVAGATDWCTGAP